MGRANNKHGDNQEHVPLRPGQRAFKEEGMDHTELVLYNGKE